MSETDDAMPLELRVWALEALVAFLFAAQHMQTPDPGAALHRLRRLLIEAPSAGVLPEDPDGRAMALAMLDRMVTRIVAMQDSLPRRLVD